MRPTVGVTECLCTAVSASSDRGVNTPSTTRKVEEPVWHNASLVDGGARQPGATLTATQLLVEEVRGNVDDADADADFDLVDAYCASKTG